MKLYSIVFKKSSLINIRSCSKLQRISRSVTSTNWNLESAFRRFLVPLFSVSVHHLPQQNNKPRRLLVVPINSTSIDSAIVVLILYHPSPGAELHVNNHGSQYLWARHHESHPIPKPTKWTCNILYKGTRLERLRLWLQKKAAIGRSRMARAKDGPYVEIRFPCTCTFQTVCC